jgi:prepilin-type N-terminal cleavage/methylation domain-containing protein
VTLTCRAFTLIEVVIVISIVVILSALIGPVLLNAKVAFNASQSLNRMLQMHQAVFLYQQEYELPVAVPAVYPPVHYVYTKYLGLGKSFFETPCGYKDGIEDNLRRLGYSYWYLPPISDDYFERWGNNAMLFSDPYCNRPSDWNSAYRSKRGLGITVSGKLINHLKGGSPGNPEWWTSRDTDF